jgi:uncharacterized membrane protein YozB (DUF420 family)/cytochrome oxidase Cu insertion factor (SCO1/SenC/PrrC family)
MRWFGYAVLAVALLLAGCSADAGSLGPVADFSLSERSGRTVRRADLEGKTWIAACTFTCCNQACPQITAHLKKLQDDLAGHDDVLLVSFSVYPEHDTPETLRAYADAHGADPDRWLFLTGPEKELYAFIRDSLGLHVEPNTGDERRPGNEVAHSPRLVLVDPQGMIRGYFDGTDPVEVEKLRRAVVRMQPALFGLRLGDLPTVNALLNSTCALLLLVGFAAIRLRFLAAHKALMLLALGVSILFLASYLYYHFHAGATPFERSGSIRVVYFGILISHTLLAVAAAPLALFTAWQGLRGRLARHVRVARWTLPIWLYVSLTGVLVWWMLYRM